MKKQGAKTAVPRLRFPEFREAEAWERTPLGKAGTFVRGLTYSAGDVRAKGLLVVRSTNIQDGNLVLDREAVFVERDCAPEQILQVGDVAICMSNGSKALVGKSAELSKPYLGQITVGAFCSIFRPSIEFAKLAFSSDSYANFVALAIGGGNINNLKNSDLESFEFAIPESAAEQQKIADCLTSLDEVIAAQGRKVEALKAHKRGLMQQLFPREGETRPRLRFPEFRDAPEWEEKKLSALVSLISGLHLSPDQYSSSGDVPYFTGPSDFTNDIKSVSKWTTVSSSVAAKHDTLITVKGSGVGECWHLEVPRVAMGRQLMAVRSKASSSQFIHQFLLTRRVRFEDLASGNLIPGLSRGDILDMVAPFPKESEQQRIADCLSSLDTRITAETNHLATLKTHKQGLMQQLFPAPEATTA